MSLWRHLAPMQSLDSTLCMCATSSFVVCRRIVGCRFYCRCSISASSYQLNRSNTWQTLLYSSCRSSSVYLYKLLCPLDMAVQARRNSQQAALYVQYLVQWKTVLAGSNGEHRRGHSSRNRNGRFISVR